jgi:hypothetical protein
LKKSYLVALAFAVVASVDGGTRAYAQSLPYADADTPSEAVGMFKMTIELASRMRRECTRNFPQLQAQIERDIGAWRALDAREIDVAERRFAAMVKASPELRDQFPAMVNQVYQNKMVHPFRGVDPDLQAKIANGYCAKFFNELATGVWHQRTPKLYQFLR